MERKIYHPTIGDCSELMSFHATDDCAHVWLIKSSYRIETDGLEHKVKPIYNGSYQYHMAISPNNDISKAGLIPLYDKSGRMMKEKAAIKHFVKSTKLIGDHITLKSNV